MGTVIGFPGNDERREKEYSELLDEELNIQNESLRKCVSANVAPVLAKYSKLPIHTFSLELPSGLSAADTDMLANKIQEEVKKYVSKIQQPMILEICQLYVALCKHEQK